MGYGAGPGQESGDVAGVASAQRDRDDRGDRSGRQRLDMSGRVSIVSQQDIYAEQLAKERSSWDRAQAERGIKAALGDIRKVRGLPVHEKIARLSNKSKFHKGNLGHPGSRGAYGALRAEIGRLKESARSRHAQNVRDSRARADEARIRSRRPSPAKPSREGAVSSLTNDRIFSDKLGKIRDKARADANPSGRIQASINAWKDIAKRSKSPVEKAYIDKLVGRLRDTKRNFDQRPSPAKPDRRAAPSRRRGRDPSRAPATRPDDGLRRGDSLSRREQKELDRLSARNTRTPDLVAQFTGSRRGLNKRQQQRLDELLGKARDYDVRAARERTAAAQRQLDLDRRRANARRAEAAANIAAAAEERVPSGGRSRGALGRQIRGRKAREEKARAYDALRARTRAAVASITREEVEDITGVTALKDIAKAYKKGEIGAAQALGAAIVFGPVGPGGKGKRAKTARGLIERLMKAVKPSRGPRKFDPPKSRRHGLSDKQLVDMVYRHTGGKPKRTTSARKLDDDTRDFFGGGKKGKGKGKGKGGGGGSAGAMRVPTQHSLRRKAAKQRRNLLKNARMGIAHYSRRQDRKFAYTKRIIDQGPAQPKNILLTPKQRRELANLTIPKPIKPARLTKKEQRQLERARQKNLRDEYDEIASSRPVRNRLIGHEGRRDIQKAIRQEIARARKRAKQDIALQQAGVKSNINFELNKIFKPSSRRRALKELDDIVRDVNKNRRKSDGDSAGAKRPSGRERREAEINSQLSKQQLKRQRQAEKLANKLARGDRLTPRQRRNLKRAAVAAGLAAAAGGAALIGSKIRERRNERRRQAPVSEVRNRLGRLISSAAAAELSPKQRRQLRNLPSLEDQAPRGRRGRVQPAEVINPRRIGKLTKAEKRRLQQLAGPPVPRLKPGKLTKAERRRLQQAARQQQALTPRRDKFAKGKLSKAERRRLQRLRAGVAPRRPDPRQARLDAKRDALPGKRKLSKAERRRLQQLTGPSITKRQQRALRQQRLQGQVQQAQQAWRGARPGGGGKLTKAERRAERRRARAAPAPKRERGPVRLTKAERRAQARRQQPKPDRRDRRLTKAERRAQARQQPKPNRRDDRRGKKRNRRRRRR